MLNKIKTFVLCIMAFGIFMPASSFAVEEEIVDIEEISADAVENYQVEGSLFQQITDLEQEKVLMQLEKERAQLDLDLDRLAAEKIKLHMEILAICHHLHAGAITIRINTAVILTAPHVIHFVTLRIHVNNTRTAIVG